MAFYPPKDWQQNHRQARYELPHLIIGAGHIGLKLAMTWIMDGYSHWVG